jgi:hypothetical protein
VMRPNLDNPGRCAWCGGPVPPGAQYCSRYCRVARTAWSNVPFSENLGEELPRGGVPDCPAPPVSIYQPSGGSGSVRRIASKPSMNGLTSRAYHAGP